MDSGAGSKASAAYGHACSNCVKAKCKCISRETGSCERCHRLAKVCQAATFARKRGSRRPASSARKSQLEDKLDNLVSLLEAQQQVPNPSLAVPTTTRLPSRHSGPPLRSTSNAEQHVDSLPTPLASEEPSPLCRGILDIPNAADVIISEFKSRMLQFFPFMHISCSPAQFLQERPMTFKAIRVAMEPSRARQNELGDQVREELALRIVAHAERSVDLLLSLFVCMTWQIYFTHARPCFGMFRSVARSIISDIRLDRPTSMVMACPGLPSHGEPAIPAETCGACTDEERRALVACFTISAMVTMSLKYDPMRWSPQIERACQVLSQNVDIPGDQVLVAVTRISKVSVEAARIVQYLAEGADYAPHALLQIKAMRGLLDQVESNLTPVQLQNTIVSIYLHMTKTVIYEAALFHQPISSPLVGTIDLQRNEYLTACLLAAKSTLDVFHSVKFVQMNMPTILAFSHATQVLFKLSIMITPGWDRALARATADVLWYFDQTASRLEEANEELKSVAGGEDSIFLSGGEAMRYTIIIWRGEMESAIAAAESAAPHPEGDPLAGFDPMDTSWLNFPDDVWLSNVFGAIGPS